ncbi:hypothetical protein [Aureitalea marina]|nr:hypothetical protein [Aureitalea marina]
MIEDEYEIRGFYRPHFLSIFINGEFDVDLEKMSQKDLGTFVHEYTHYLQNISTVFGLRNSVYFFRYLFEVKQFVHQNQSINIPLKEFEISKALEEGKERFDFFHGHPKALHFEYESINWRLGKGVYQMGRFITR